MEVSPKTLREVEFREKKLGGYHPDDVDEFLERVAVGIEVYQEKLRQASERINHLERQLAEATKQGAQPAARPATSAPTPQAQPPGETEEALKRTLLLAQRTADMAVAEAKAEAGEIVTKAKGEAHKVLDEAREAARKMAGEAEREIHGRLRTLEVSRATLEDHVGTLKKFLDTEHKRLRQGLTDAARLLEENVARMSEVPVMPAGTDAPAPPPPPPPPPAADGVAPAQGSARDAVRQMLASTTGSPNPSGGADKP